MNYKPVIGLEVHVELRTKSKMFCGCSADYFGQKPNTHTCPICLGLPGTLPVPNKKAIEWCVMVGQALNCNINNFSKFDRKNYFYPDLPKGYQISQYDQPFCTNGYVHLEGETNEHLPGEAKKRIRIRRVHMEEDTGKLIHQGDSTLIDFNRSGVPLVEIVTEPDFETSAEVVEYLKKLQQIVRYLGVSDADMEKGNMRLEPNISLRINDEGLRIKKRLPNYKVEVKNINSFRFVEKAIEYEIKRQDVMLKGGKTPAQETRGWDEDKQKTVTQRAKEEANDYRYFPEPDIPPIRISASQISSLKSQMPELPDAKLARFINEYNLSIYDAEILTREKIKADHFEKVIKEANKNSITPKQVANFIINEKFVNIKGKEFDWTSMSPVVMIKLYLSLNRKTSIDEKALERAVKNVIAENTKAVEDFKSGKETALMFLIGQTIRQFKGKIDVKKIIEMLKKVLQ